jgi:hypothetical protein
VRALLVTLAVLVLLPLVGERSAAADGPSFHFVSGPIHVGLPVDIAGTAVAGVRGVVTSADAHQDGAAAAAQAALGYDGAVTFAAISARSWAIGTVGGGSDGFGAGIRSGLSLGGRLEVARDHGPVARLGASAAVQGNQRMFDGYGQAPEVQLGYQAFGPRWGVDVVARGGLVVGGRFRPSDEADREIGPSGAGGALALVAMTPLSLSADYLRIFATDTGSVAPIDHLAAHLCFARTLAVCGDLALATGETAQDGAWRRSTVVQGGLTVGVGRAGALGHFSDF